jgi:hypothetical protein
LEGSLGRKKLVGNPGIDGNSECGKMLPNYSVPKIGVQQQDIVMSERNGTNSCRK